MSNFDSLVKKAGLNRSQQKFCKINENKNVRLLAPAGSGKTFSLLWRCRYITDQAKERREPKPYFLLVTFTRSAKMELEERLKKDKNFRNINAMVRTLNSWGWEQIKKPGYELISSGKQRKLLANHDLNPLYKKYELIGNGFKTPYGKAHNSEILIDLIDLLKSLGFTHKMSKSMYNEHIKYLKEIGLYSFLTDEYEKLYQIEGIQGESKSIKDKGESIFFEFWKKAVILLDSVNRYTFEDQKYWARIYLEEQIELNNISQGNSLYTHIMVDEFQDINPLDLELIKCVCKYNGQNKKPVSLTIIGDDDQAIFGWRGTTPKFILNPGMFFGVNFITCVLDTNYRSPKKIVEISNKLLSHNEEREPKEMKSVAKGRAIVKVIQKKKIVSSIDATMKLVDSLAGDEEIKSIALIGRRHVSVFPYQVLMSSKGTPYFVDADIDIFYGEAMQSLQNIIQIVYRAKDDDVDDPISAVLTICDKIGSRQLQNSDREEIYNFIDEREIDSFYDAVEALKSYPKEIKKHNPKEIAKVIIKLVESKSVYRFMELVEKELHGLDKDYTKREIDNHYKEPQFFRLKEISKRYEDDFRKFYKDIEKAKKAGERSRHKSNDDSVENYRDIMDTKIHLLTATRSKGHEYDAVIILDVDYDEWPNRLTDDIEEERRLFYVALSRARKYLAFITSEEKRESIFLSEAGLL